MKRVPVFVYVKEGKVARGSVDFFNEAAFQKFIGEGGSIALRWEGGDVGLSVEASSLSSDPPSPQE